MIRSRPLADAAAAWEVVCPAPLIKRGEDAQQLFVAGRRLYQAVNPGVHCFRPLDYLGPTWDRITAPLWPDGLAVAGGRVFGNDRTWLLVRVAPAHADPSHVWEPVAPWPTGCNTLVADGDQLLAFGGEGPIYARPVKAGPEEPWKFIGRVHDPSKP
jgi:hypothetical protein